MDSWVLWFLLLPSIFQYPQPAGDGLDEVTRLRMELRAKLQEEERIRLEREVEQLVLLQSGASWGDLEGDKEDWSSLQPWQVWAFAGLLVLLLALWFLWRRRSHEAEISGEDENEMEEEEEDETRAYDLRWLLEERLQWPVHDLQTGCSRTTALMDNLISVLRDLLRGTFYPVLQQAVGLGSAFEGWSANEQEVVYRVLVPLTPPLGHIFYLEHDTGHQRPGRNFRIHVDLECHCARQRPDAHVLCYRHNADIVRWVTGQPYLLDTLCSGSSLDVKKTIRWFGRMVTASWRLLPQSQSWHLELLPSKRSCTLRLTNSQESFRVRVLFGVRRHGSDIFVSSRSRGAHMPRTLWPETYGVAERKFFRHVAGQVPPDSSHLKCLQLLNGVRAREGLPGYAIKTILMRLLNTLPASHWQEKYFLLQLSDVLEHLRLSLEEKHLEHFILGNQTLPEEITVPLDVRQAEPPNLFRGMEHDPALHSQVMQAYLDLQQRLARVLAYGHS